MRSDCLVILISIIYLYIIGCDQSMNELFDDLNKRDSSRLSSDDSFIQLVNQMKGYYKLSNDSSPFSNTIVITAVNSGYKDLLHNFKCYCDRLGIKFLVVSLDEGMYSYISNNKLFDTYLLGDLPGRGKVTADPSSEGKNFNLIGCRRIEVVGAALKLGYDVLFSDVDVALIRDPLQFMYYFNVDYIHTTNVGCGSQWTFNESSEGNTGSIDRQHTIRLWDLTYRLCAKSPLQDDQSLFWKILKLNKEVPLLAHNSCSASSIHKDYDSSNLISCAVDSCMFSSGDIRDSNGLNRLVDSLHTRNQSSVIIHTNWMADKGSKKQAMARSGLWIARRVPPVHNSSGNHANKSKLKPLTGSWTCIQPSNKLIALPLIK